MNQWTTLSIEYANQRSYLDDLFSIYPTIPEGIRDIDLSIWEKVENSFKNKDNESLIKNLLDLDLFPIKDSYVAFFRRDRSSISRNPRTVNRIAGRLYEMGLNKIYERASEPKETNRQIGPMFRDWLSKGALGMQVLGIENFKNTSHDAILGGGDRVLLEFANENLNYNHEKGLDLICRIKGKYVIGEAKFLTDYGGHQNAQFNDAISTLLTDGVAAEKVAILDGVLYISKGQNRMYRSISESYMNYNIMSALVLREFLYQL